MIQSEDVPKAMHIWGCGTLVMQDGTRPGVIRKPQLGIENDRQRGKHEFLTTTQIGIQHPQPTTPFLYTGNKLKALVIISMDLSALVLSTYRCQNSANLEKKTAQRIIIIILLFRYSSAELHRHLVILHIFSWHLNRPRPLRMRSIRFANGPPDLFKLPF